MSNRDALWVRPDGTTSVVTVDEQGNPIIASEPKPAEPEIPATEPVTTTRKRRKR